MRLTGQDFINSDTCKGTVYVPEGAPMDFAEIMISGRYPEEDWAVNREVYEIVRVHRGAGSLAVRGAGVTKLLQGDMVHVPPNTAFAWQGNMTLHMTCSPPFNSEQYEVIKEESI